jgi:O-antigen/teichoic acid export membrane protein
MSRLSKNIIYNLFGQGLLIVLGFVAVRFIFRQLGEDALGIIYFTLTMNAVLCAVLEMGICSTTVREVSVHSESDPNYIQDLVRTFSLFYWGAYALLGVVIFFLAPILVEKWINLKTMDMATATQVLQILGISALLALPRSFYTSLFRGLQRMEINNIIDVSASLIQQIGIIVVLILGGGLLSVIYWIAVSFGIWILFYILAVRRFFPWRALVPGFSNVVVRRNLGYSSNMMSISLLAIIHMQSDKIIVSKLLPVSLFGFYGFAYSVVSKATLLTSSVAQAAFPSFSSLFKIGGRDSMMTQYRKLHDLLCFGTVPLFGVIPFAVLPVFGFVFNPDVARMLLLPITFLTLGFYMNGALNVPYVFSLAVGKPEISAKSNFLALFIVLPVTGILIYFFGLTGAGFSWVFYHLFAYSYAVPRICSECLGIPVREWYLHIFKILVLVILTYGVGWAFLKFIGSYSILSLVLAYTGATIVFLTCAYFMIDDELKNTIVKFLQAGRGRFSKVIVLFQTLSREK